MLSGCVGGNAQVVLQTISFAPETLQVNAGNSKQLNPIFNPTVFSSIAVEWSSTDGTVATISSTGYLYALKPGTTWIKIKDKNSATWGKCMVVVQ